MSFEELIKEYSRQLLKMKDESKFPDFEEKEKEEELPAEDYKENEKTKEQETVIIPKEEAEELNEEDRSIENMPNIEITDFSPDIKEPTPSFSLKEEENFAVFSANVFAGDNTYPVENAKVSVYKDDEIFAFLSTDENGLTKKIKLPSYPESNSLDPKSSNQSIDYYADIFAKGFTSQKGLLVSAVGGSDIVLDVSMTPLSDEVN